jgi:predicted DCC family thiol-disulfide oxidoreductase YuxK
MMNRHTVLFDDECSMCTFQMKVLSWLDWRNVLALVPLSDPQAHNIAPQLKLEDLQEAIHCITPQGRVYRGARAIRFLGLRLPLLVPLTLFMWIPGVIWIAEIVYAWVSRNRTLLSRVFGCKDACAIMPARKREQDKLA